MHRHQQHRKLPLSGIFASKRVAVALCAAIAMVLGAMSVGASMGVVPSNSPTTTLPAASQTGPSIDSNGQIIQDNPKSIVKDFSSQNTVAPVLLAPNKPAKSSSSSAGSILPIKTNVTLGPISVSVAPQSASLQLDTPVTDPLNVIITNPLDTSATTPADNSSGDASTGSDQTPTTTPETPQSITTNNSSDSVAQN